MKKDLIKKIIFSGLLASIFAISSMGCALTMNSSEGDSSESLTSSNPLTSSSSESSSQKDNSQEVTSQDSSSTGNNSSSGGGTEKPVVSSSVELYQLAPENSILMQSYVIKTKENKLIVIDGGIDGAGIYADPYLPSAMRAILGLGEEDYFEVEAWFLSHAHKDHFYELAKMLNEYHEESNYKINNFYFDFPEFDSIEYPVTNPDQDYLELLKYGFDNYAEVNEIDVKKQSYYDDLNGAVINEISVARGLDITIDDIRFEIMQTWDITDSYQSRDVNATSLVMRAWVEEQSILFLNDIGVASADRLLAKYGADLKSDIVQMAHHGQRGCGENVYNLVKADVYLWPTPKFVWTNTTSYEIAINRKWVNNGVDFTTASAQHIVACLYKDYPTIEDCASVSAWAKVKDCQKITLPYTY